MPVGSFTEAVIYPGGLSAKHEAIRVVLPDTDTDATLFADLAGTPLANPVTTDALGNLFFCAEAGTYDLLIREARIRVGVTGGSEGGSTEAPAFGFDPTGAMESDLTTPVLPDGEFAMGVWNAVQGWLEPNAYAVTDGASSMYSGVPFTLDPAKTYTVQVEWVRVAHDVLENETYPLTFYSLNDTYDWATSSWWQLGKAFGKQRAESGSELIVIGPGRENWAEAVDAGEHHFMVEAPVDLRIVAVTLYEGDRTRAAFTVNGVPVGSDGTNLILPPSRIGDVPLVNTVIGSPFQDSNTGGSLTPKAITGSSHENPANEWLKGSPDPTLDGIDWLRITTPDDVASGYPADTLMLGKRYLYSFGGMIQFFSVVNRQMLVELRLGGSLSYVIPVLPRLVGGGTSTQYNFDFPFLVRSIDRTVEMYVSWAGSGATTALTPNGASWSIGVLAKYLSPTD